MVGGVPAPVGTRGASLLTPGTMVIMMMEDTGYRVCPLSGACLQVLGGGGVASQQEAIILSPWHGTREVTLHPYLGSSWVMSKL